MIVAENLASASADVDAALTELREHLLIAPLPVWVDVVLRTDPTLHHDILEWIIGQPECDLSIAQLVFFRAKPGQYLRRRLSVDPEAPYRDPLCLTICELAAEGRYQEAQLGLDFKEIARERNDLKSAMSEVDRADWAFDIPDRFLTKSSLPALRVERLWRPEHDNEILGIYARTGLQIESADEKAAKAPNNSLGVLHSFVGRLRSSAPPELA